MFILYDYTSGNSAENPSSTFDRMSSVHIYYIIYEQQF